MINLYVHRSGTHAHLSKQLAERLGLMSPPPKKKDLAIRGEYVTEYSFVIAKGDVTKKLPILGPWRNYSQIETCVGDARKLRMLPPELLETRLSGDVQGLPAIEVYIIGEYKTVPACLPVMIPQPHIHGFILNSKPKASLVMDGLRIDDIALRMANVPRNELLLHLTNDEYNLVMAKQVHELYIGDELVECKKFFGNKYAPTEPQEWNDDELLQVTKKSSL